MFKRTRIVVWFHRVHGNDFEVRRGFAPLSGSALSSAGSLKGLRVWFAGVLYCVVFRTKPSADSDFITITRNISSNAGNRDRSRARSHLALRRPHGVRVVVFFLASARGLEDLEPAVLVLAERVASLGQWIFFATGRLARVARLSWGTPLS